MLTKCFQVITRDVVAHLVGHPDGAAVRAHGEGQRAAQALVVAGVDVIDVSGGLSGSGRDRLTEQGFFVYLAEGVPGAPRLYQEIGRVEVADANAQVRMLPFYSLFDSLASGGLMAPPTFTRLTAPFLCNQ